MNKSVVLNVYGIYLPHDNHKIEQLEIYMETLDQLQTCIDRHQDDGAAVIVVGDTNTRLPQSLKLAKSWYEKKPFNHRSALLYNFLTDNDMIVANFKFKQQKDSTYYKTGAQSYIDHVFAPNYVYQSIHRCQILYDKCENTSDHFALSCTLELPNEIVNVKTNYRSKEYFP